MEEVKLTVEISDIKLNIQCDPKWLAEQMAFLVENYPELFKGKNVRKGPERKENVESLPLMTFLQKKKALSMQNRRFLGTAIWLMGKGQKKFKVRDITGAMQENNIPKIKSPAASRYQLGKRGILKYDGRHFVVTEKGMGEL